ncbi:MAG: hypothetical protein HC892_01195 [Saprospiraceae bacterium]|nr:hypothetical protein [Saprospiraceae bacterium]
MKNNWYKYLSVVLVVVAILVLSTTLLEAQCPMCKIAVQSNMQNGGTAGKGLNKGIFIILGMPYLIVGTIAYIWWRNKRKLNEA